MMMPAFLPRFFRFVAAIAISLFGAAALARADVVETIGGSVLHGRVLSTDEGVVKIETEFAGVVAVKQAQVKSITTDAPVFVQTKGGNIAKGRLETASGGLLVAGDAGSLQTEPTDIVAVWREGDKSPAERLADSLARRWTYEVAADLSGKKGNSERLFLGLSGRAEVKTPQDRLFFFGSYAQAEDDGEKTQDEGKFGVDYSNYFTEKWSWYVRTELGFDGTKDLDLRSQSAAGIGRTFIRRPNQTLEGRFGLSYRFEDYGTGADFDSGGLDFGVMHSLSMRWARMTNSITFTPSFDDFANYVLIHESALEMPMAIAQSWKLRLGVKNDYTSEPPLGLKKHDWSYFSQIVLTWR